MLRTVLKNCTAYTAGILLIACLGSYLSVVLAGDKKGLQVYSASSHLQGDMLYLDTQLEYRLSRAALDALDSGVPLVFELEVEIFTPRDWLWDKTLASYRFRYRLLYHALTQQYIVTNINSGIQNSYSRRNTALLSMGRIHNLPLVEMQQLPVADKYLGRVRVSLDIGSLPAPMRPWAYINTDWLLASEWFTWEIN